MLTAQPWQWLNHQTNSLYHRVAGDNAEFLEASSLRLGDERAQQRQAKAKRYTGSKISCRWIGYLRLQLWRRRLVRHAASAATFAFALSPMRWQMANTRSARFIV